MDIIDKFNKAVDRLEAKGFVFSGASGTSYRYYIKAVPDGVQHATLYPSGAVRYATRLDK